MNTPQLTLDQMLGIRYPLLVAPMFLVSDTAMVKAALDAGATAAIPALNYRTAEQLSDAIRDIGAYSNKPFGINLIVNRSNPRYKAQLKVVLKDRPDFVITSLGNPAEVIDKCKPLGIKVFCDVVNLDYALKVEKLGADALIAVNNSAGGHCGQLAAEELMPLLRKHCQIPVILAGGVSLPEHMANARRLGAAGVSAGTVFIATHESPVSDEYKQALVHFGADDIVLTSRLSGSQLTVIRTPYFESLGESETWLERLYKRQKWARKYIKMAIFASGMQKIEQAAFKATYKTIWVAGPAIEHVKSIRPLGEIVHELGEGWFAC
ncbi:MAG TPA: nitronate monooxygenase [Bacteroidales bacterium]|nr:nitronate monooxygenase [Bacteroidales bacterium]